MCVAVQVAGCRCAIDDRRRGDSRRNPEHLSAEARPDEVDHLDDGGPTSEPTCQRHVEVGRKTERQDDVEAPGDLDEGRDGRHHCPQLTEQPGLAAWRPRSAWRSPWWAGKSSAR